MDVDGELLERWRAGDQAAGRDLFARYFDPLFRFFANKCNEPDELVQATFFALVKARDQFAGSLELPHVPLHDRAQRAVPLAAHASSASATFDPELSSIAEVATTAGSRLARNEEHRRLCAALRTLPVESQTLLELHYWEGLDAAALAEVFGTINQNIRARLSRARAALREALARLETAPRPGVESDEGFDTWARQVSVAG
jgi:RNA polymerase sigma factor (sigma-70 family)